MSIVDGCVLVVCSGADERFWPSADQTDRTAYHALAAEMSDMVTGTIVAAVGVGVLTGRS
jgi:hypothetical protein